MRISSGENSVRTADPEQRHRRRVAVARGASSLVLVGAAMTAASAYGSAPVSPGGLPLSQKTVEYGTALKILDCRLYTQDGSVPRRVYTQYPQSITYLGGVDQTRKWAAQTDVLFGTLKIAGPGMNSPAPVPSPSTSNAPISPVTVWVAQEYDVSKNHPRNAKVNPPQYPKFAAGPGELPDDWHDGQQYVAHGEHELLKQVPFPDGQGSVLEWTSPSYPDYNDAVVVECSNFHKGDLAISFPVPPEKTTIAN